MTRTVVVVGVGNFGGWWLLALSRIEKNTKFLCLDTPEKVSFALGRLRNDEGYSHEDNSFQQVNTVHALPKFVDLVVVATNSDVRLEVIINLSKNIQSEEWVVEKAIAQSEDEILEIARLLENSKVFVNHSRPLQPSHVLIGKTVLELGGIKSALLQGGKYELASNSSHFLFNVNVWSGDKFLGVDTSGLAKKWHASSTRSGFYDVGGHLKAMFSNGIELDLDWKDKNSRQSKWIITCQRGNITYDEISGDIFLNGVFYENSPLLNFSDLIPLIFTVGSKFSGAGVLPELEEVIGLHCILTTEFKRHYSASIGHKQFRLPLS